MKAKYKVAHSPVNTVLSLFITEPEHPESIVGIYGYQNNIDVFG
jgi:hypothetical protein